MTQPDGLTLSMSDLGRTKRKRKDRLATPAGLHVGRKGLGFGVRFAVIPFAGDGREGGHKEIRLGCRTHRGAGAMGHTDGRSWAGPFLRAYSYMYSYVRIWGCACGFGVFSHSSYP